LREAFHPLAGFLVGWITFFVIYAGTIATLAAGFAKGLGVFVSLTPAAELLVAIGLVLAVSALNIAGVRWGALANNATAYVKIAALVIFALLVPLLGEGNLSNLAARGAGVSEIGFTAFGLALAPVLFSYLGWNSSIYVASEIRDPERNLPRSLFLGLGICTAIYLLVNGAYLYILPVDELQNAANAGEAAARAVFGSFGGRLVGALVLTSILGTLNSTILVGPRIPYAMALDGLFFRGVDRTHASYRTPVVAIAVQALMAVGLLLGLTTFERALSYTTFAILLATMADVLALYRLRRVQPDRRRPYRAWGYPWIPALYFVANTAIALALLVAQPFESLAGLSIAATGLPFYWLFTRSRDSRTSK
jgi:APA family basic amino acid/polyamine antiporter